MEDTLNRQTQFGGAKLIIGTFFVLHGLLLAADNLGLLDAWRYLRYWPAVILLVGIYRLWQPGRQLAGIILTVAGASLLAQSVGLLRLSIFDLWPLLLIIGGIAIIARATGFEVSSGDTRNILAVFTARKIAPREFDGARIVAVMGGCELDLTDADMKNSPAVIEAFTMWGGIEIFVPDTWEILGEVVPVMAGFEVKVAPVGTPQHQLIVRGTAIMAGIEIKRRRS
jgi:predicted membrane protein